MAIFKGENKPRCGSVSSAGINSSPSPQVLPAIRRTSVCRLPHARLLRPSLAIGGTTREPIGPWGVIHSLSTALSICNGLIRPSWAHGSRPWNETSKTKLTITTSRSETLSDELGTGSTGSRPVRWRPISVDVSLSYVKNSKR